jgi:hypothetical protein
MQPFSRQMGDCILYTIINLSDVNMEGFVRTQFNDFVDKPYSDRELYDFFAEIAKLPVQHTIIDGRNFCSGPISSFIQTACDVTKYYVRPEDGERKLLDREFCERQLEHGYSETDNL